MVVGETQIFRKHPYIGGMKHCHNMAILSDFALKFCACCVGLASKFHDPFLEEAKSWTFFLLAKFFVQQIEPQQPRFFPDGAAFVQCSIGGSKKWHLMVTS